MYILYYGVLPKFPFTRVICNVFVGSMEVHNVVGETKPVFFFFNTYGSRQNTQLFRSMVSLCILFIQ